MIQLQVINRILASEDPSLIIMNNLDNSYFSDYYQEYKFINDHLETYGQLPDMVTFLNEFPDFDVVQVNETNSYLIDELIKDKQKRYLAKSFNKVRELLQNNEVDKAVQVFTTAADSVIQSKNLQSVDLVNDDSRYKAYTDRITDFSRYYVKTGFKELDELLGGWERYEELATLVARPGVGKSWCMLKSATAALEQGLNVGIYSGEMSAMKVGYRFDTLVSHISNFGITKGANGLQNEYKRHMENLPKKFDKGCLKVLTPAGISGPAGVKTLRAFIEKEHLDILFVDQHSLLEDDRHGRTPVERAANISKDLKNLQVLKRIPIIAVSQQNRTADTENGEILDVSRIAQSDRIGQDSTIVLFFEQKDSVLTIHLAKSRDSVSGKKLCYAIDLDKGIFSYLPADTDAIGGMGAQALAAEFGDDGEDVF